MSSDRVGSSSARSAAPTMELVAELREQAKRYRLALRSAEEQNRMLQQQIERLKMFKAQSPSSLNK